MCALASISIRTLAVLDSIWTWRITASFKVLESDMVTVWITIYQERSEEREFRVAKGLYIFLAQG